tara:strand:- start:2063 stop:2701 length:639 start_codon:yes stop_codon:yes gene_type:complete
MYSIKEIYYTLQGEGAHTGRPAVFLRFAGCNLWTGREEDRHKAVCQFCDTDFVGTDGPGGGRFPDSESLALAVNQVWSDHTETDDNRYVVCTGGEPLLQLDKAAIDSLHAEGFLVAVETNGTQDPPPGLDWICMSPKALAPVKLMKGNELKLVFPQEQAMPDQFENMEFDHYFLQPMDGPELEENTAAAIAYCLRFPKWRLSVQTHKVIGVA